MVKEFIYGVLAGAGLLALFQNLGDYRIDTEFMEYVFDPIKNFFLHIFGKATVSRLETKGKAIAVDVHAKLDNLLRSGETDAVKIKSDVQKIFDALKAKL